MHCKKFTLALVISSAAVILDEPVTATFRNIPIALPPLGEPVTLRPRGTYDIKLVHQWPPLHFDRWTPVEYYEPYGYVYECQDDGREYIFDSHATRPVLREILRLQEPVILEPTVVEPIFTFSKPSTILLAEDSEPTLLHHDTHHDSHPDTHHEKHHDTHHDSHHHIIVDKDSVLPASGTVQIKVPANTKITPITETVLIREPTPYPGKHLRGVVEAFTNLPAAIIRDAIGQGKAILVGKERKILDLERFFGDIFHRDCADGELCTNAANSWLSYISAVQEQAANFEKSIKHAYTGVHDGSGFEELDKEMILDCGRALIHKIENARLMLMKECETLPNIIDKNRLKQLLITPLEYLQREVEDKSDELHEKKLDISKAGIQAINKHSAKMESHVISAMEHLIHFPLHILHDIKGDFGIEY